MEREIKFRAWDGKQMHWLDYLWNNHWYNSQKGGQASMDNSNIPCDREYNAGRLKIMQYTGLKDKNGKEIYEGDYIEIEMEDATKRGSVTFDHERGIWNPYLEAHNEYWYTFQQLATDFGATITVIGNVYEHPNLLN